MAKEALFCLLCLVFTANGQSSNLSIYQGKLKRMYDFFNKTHNKEILPQSSYGDPVNVSLNLYLGNIDDFDELSGILTLTLSVEYEWNDKRQLWHDNEELNEVQSLTITSSKAWLPYFYVKESAGKISALTDDKMRLRLDSFGKFSYKVITVISVKCDVDVSYYPFDEQTCEITMSPWGYKDNEILLHPRQKYLNVDSAPHDSLWEVLPSKIIRETSDNQSEVKLSIHLKRRSTFHVVYIIIPLILFAILNKCVFLLPHTSGERIGVSVTMFLAFNVYLLLANEIVPASSKPLAKLFYYLLYLMIYSAGIMILMIVSLRIYSKAEHDEQEPEPPVAPCIVMVTTRITWAFGCQMLKSGRCRTNKGDGVTDKRQGEEKPVTWNDVGKVFDMSCFFILLILNTCVFIGLISGVST